MAGNFLKGLLGFFVGLLTLGASFVLGLGGIIASGASGDPTSLILLIPLIISIMLIFSPIYFWILKPAGIILTSPFRSSSKEEKKG